MDSEVGAHINLLELKAASLPLRSFVSTQINKHILIRMDNRVAIAYVNAKGGTRSKALNQEALEIWDWCLKRNLTIQTEHAPGILNTEADFESRHSQDPSDWMLQVLCSPQFRPFEDHCIGTCLQPDTTVSSLTTTVGEQTPTPQESMPFYIAGTTFRPMRSCPFV